MERRITLQDRLVEEARQMREQAAKATRPKERERLIRKARQIETAAQINEWVSSPGLQPPR
jgi:hypothetical protein